MYTYKSFLKSSTFTYASTTSCLIVEKAGSDANSEGTTENRVSEK